MTGILSEVNTWQPFRDRRPKRLCRRDHLQGPFWRPFRRSLRSCFAYFRLTQRSPLLKEAMNWNVHIISWYIYGVHSLIHQRKPSNDYWVPGQHTYICKCLQPRLIWTLLSLWVHSGEVLVRLVFESAEVSLNDEVVNDKTLRVPNDGSPGVKGSAEAWAIGYVEMLTFESPTDFLSLAAAQFGQWALGGTM